MTVKSGDVYSSTSNKSSNHFCSSKKGQVTIFIIVGIVLLFAFAGIMYFTKSVTKDKLTAEGDPVLSAVPAEFQSISTYTESCVSQYAKKGLVILGQQGGYIYPSLVGEYSVSDPTNSDGINLEPLKIPYWHYNQLPNEQLEIGYSSLTPKLYFSEDKEMSIEAQLQRYVEENLDNCLVDYKPFENEGYQVELASSKESRSVTTTVGENSVNFLLDMPIKASRGTSSHEMNQFYVKVPLRLKHYYEVAQEITSAETNHSFLESQGLDLIAIYSGMDINKLPPTEAVTFDMVPSVYWAEEDVKGKVTEMLVSNVPLLRYTGSENFYRYEYEPDTESAVDLSLLFQKNYDNMALPLDTAENINVDFDYFGWPIYFDLNDKNGLIKPSSFGVSYFTLRFNSNHYYNVYDITYPVLVTLNDPAALGGEGYSFVIALESNIRNNERVVSDQILPPPIASLETSLACKDNQRSTELITSVVVDSYTQEPIEAVQIGLSLPQFDDCLFGETDDQGVFADSYPAVYGGLGTYYKEEYLSNFYPIDTYAFNEQPGIIGYAVAGSNQKVVQMHKHKTTNFKVKKKMVSKCVGGNCFSLGPFSEYAEEDIVVSKTPENLDNKHTWVYFGTKSSLSPTETATITLKRISDITPNVINDEFFSVGTVNGNTVGEMDLVPGIYELSILITNSEELIIPKEERCINVFTCYDLDETILDTRISGQLLWDEEKYYITITPEDLYSSNELVFYAVGMGWDSVPEKSHVRVMEDLEIMGNLGNYSKLYYHDLQPEYN
jgi:hypothetical protein